MKNNPLHRKAQDRSGVEGAVSLIHEHVSGQYSQTTVRLSRCWVDLQAKYCLEAEIQGKHAQGRLKPSETSDGGNMKIHWDMAREGRLALDCLCAIREEGLI